MTHDQLEDYINRFQEHQRESVAKQIIDSELLKNAFDTPHGRQILNSAVDLIASNVMKLIRDSCDSKLSQSLKLEGIQVASSEINTAYKLMMDWAKIIIRGNEHKEKAEKIK